MKFLAEMVSQPLKNQLAAVEKEFSRGATRVMKEETTALKNELRQQITEAGMGKRLADTWRAQVYPKGATSLNPAGFVWSKAPIIIDSYVRGATIRPVNGAKWLWIPTKNVPRRKRAGNYSSSLGKRAGGTAMTPLEVELHFNSELHVFFESGRGFSTIDTVSGLRGGFRPATAGRLAGRRGMAPRKAKPVLMFTLVRGVKMPRLFDLQGPTDRAAGRIARRFGEMY